MRFWPQSTNASVLYRVCGKTLRAAGCMRTCVSRDASTNGVMGGEQCYRSGVSRRGQMVALLSKVTYIDRMHGAKCKLATGASVQIRMISLTKPRQRKQHVCHILELRLPSLPGLHVACNYLTQQIGGSIERETACRKNTTVFILFGVKG